MDRHGAGHRRTAVIDDWRQGAGGDVLRSPSGGIRPSAPPMRGSNCVRAERSPSIDRGPRMPQPRVRPFCASLLLPFAYAGSCPRTRKVPRASAGETGFRERWSRRVVARSSASAATPTASSHTPTYWSPTATRHSASPRRSRGRADASAVITAPNRADHDTRTAQTNCARVYHCRRVRAPSP